ncbi:MAG: RimK family alpha-L-glutamate ligase [Desulfobulbus sp.]|nr:MAG: RimK family alpha-L-glutamate ligase [Desulfobulbus sp.]
MTNLIVVYDPADWPLDIPGVEVVAARSYLTRPEYATMQNAKVFNLSRYYRYQSTGYYVSLLAAARGHKPLPDITTIQDFKSQTILKIASENLDEIIQKSLAKIRSKDFVLSIYFGHNLAKRYETLSQELFKLFRSPLLRATFAFHDKSGHWLLQSLRPIPASEIPAEHFDFVMEAARQFFRGHHGKKRKPTHRYDLAILHNPGEGEPPSNKRALRKFQKAAGELHLAPELITKDDYGRLAEFDALFIRETTGVNHHTYRFARRAVAKNLVAIDDPESILKCTNKVFLAELLHKHRVLIPRTIIVHRANAERLPEDLGFPCIIKQPDSSFSQGVYKVNSLEELRLRIDKMLERSDLIIAQEFLPTAFDWRVGILDRQPLFVSKYYMAPQHWQIIKRNAAGAKTKDGQVETIPVAEAPPRLLKIALKAANLIGDGLYGVDIKQSGGRYYIIEINDNPNIDAGYEDRALGDELYRKVMEVFLRRLDTRRLPVASP